VLDAIAGLPFVRVWDLETGALRATLDLSPEHDLPTALAFARGRSAFAVGTARGRVLLYTV
jgi:hypothetical protein